MTFDFESARRRVLTVEEFDRKAKKTDLFERVTQRIIEESRKEPVDERALKQARDWSILANQVVGAENF